MPIPDLLIRGKSIVTPSGVRAAAIHISGGKIIAVTAPGEVPPGCPVEDAGDSIVMPGLVDTHVHINEPGRTDWEGFETATHAAAAGGVTTLIEMPLNSIPATTTVSAYQEKLVAAMGKLQVDMGFWGGVVPGNTGELRRLWGAGVFGFKCFLVESGVPEFAAVTEQNLREAMPELTRLGAVLLAHAETPGPIERVEWAAGGGAPTKYATWLASRPKEAEHEAIALLIRLAQELGTRVHIVHLSSADALPMLRHARASRAPISVETCPHYLMFAAEEIPDGATEFKCAPPIRDQENREWLWAELRQGQIDMVATDHSPAPPARKCRESGDFLKAWGGIASLQLSLPIVWTQAKKHSCGVEELTKWMCREPARLAGLERQKGAIAAGYDADLVVWDPEESFRVQPERLHHRHKLTPYAGMELKGTVRATYLRGRKIFDGNGFPAGPAGVILRRDQP